MVSSNHLILHFYHFRQKCKIQIAVLNAGCASEKSVTCYRFFKSRCINNKYYEQIDKEITEIECDLTFPDSWSIVRLGSICSLVDGEKSNGAYPCLDAKFLRGKSTAVMMQSGKFVHKADNIILVDGENSGEVFCVPTGGYMGSTFKQLWVSSQLHLPYVLDFILFYKEQLRNSKKGAAIPHLNKDIFYNFNTSVKIYRTKS